MYRYDEFDHDFVKARVADFGDQVERRLAGEITEDQFRPLRLMNGVYFQLHAYMLRIAVPYGTLSSKQMRMLGHIARKYDKGYGHFTTRQNIQFNWPALSDIPAILADLASVEMHAIQTSGNCIRNITADHFAGAAADEAADPRPYAEILRQWSSVHPEFSYLPGKFKIAVTGAERDRAAIQTHEIGLHLKKNDKGKLGFAVYIGGGQGRTPMVAKKIRDFLPEEHLLSYTTAILRVYNLHGRRDNKHKARIKILVHETGVDEIIRQVEHEWQARKDGELRLPKADVAALQSDFAPPALTARPEGDEAVKLAWLDSRSFGDWVDQNVFTHRNPDYAAVTISLKGIGEVPGDATDSQMEAVADIAEKYGFDEIRVSHEQNLILPHVARADLKTVYDALMAMDLATSNSNLISDIIACPGLDYCALANARSIPVAQEISRRFASLERQRDIGVLKLKISGCINACGHHHVGHIGILGVEKKGAELYQVTLGGSADAHTSVGEIIGRGFSPEEITDAIETIVETYLGIRLDRSEKFLDAYRRVGPAPFKEALYASEAKAAEAGIEAQVLAEAAALDALYGNLTPVEIIARAATERFAGEIAAVSSFGADSAVLLHMIAEVDRKLPVIFLDTGKHFGETLDYRDALAADFDPTGNLHQTSTDACCDVRKVEPMARGVEPFRAWFTGRKRFQAATRAALPVFEQVGPRFRINPLARWTTSDLADYMRKHALRENPLVAYGYLSIGCFPCTQIVKPGEDARSGRWAGQAKTECGIHLSGLEQSLTDASL